MAKTRFLQAAVLAALLLLFAPPAQAYRIDQDKEHEFYQKMTPKERDEYNNRMKDRILRQDNRLHHRRDKIKTRQERLEAWRQHEKDVRNRKMRKKIEEILQRQREAEKLLGKEGIDAETRTALTGAGPGVGRNALESGPPGPPTGDTAVSVAPVASEIAPPYGKTAKKK